MDRDQLCDSLVTWLQTFNVEGASGSVEELTDGVAMAHVLHQIAPTFFSESWLTKIKVDVAGNWRLKVSNLKKILKGILDYYSEVLNQHINDFHMPDVNAIGESTDMVELGRLLQLILGCAVNCDEKHEYIQRIMAMEEAVQHGVMNAIQELMTKEAPSAGAEGSTETSDQLKRTIEELNRVIEAKEEISQRCHELDLQVAALQEEKASLVTDNDRLNERLNQADSLEDPSTPAGRRYQQLQNQVEQLQEENFRVEAGRDDMKIKVELHEKEILELQQKNEELSSLADEARALKDEMDILRHTSDKVTKYEQTIDTYKKKLEEMSDLRGQLKMLEEKNTSYMQKNMDLEEELRKSSAMKSQLELYKRQVQELQIKSSEETRRADKAEFEAKRMNEKLTSAQQEKTRLIAERDQLKETNEELRCTQIQNDSLQGDADLTLEGSSVEMLAIPPEIKERLIRLQHENKMLKLQRAASEDDQVQMVRSMLDDANSRNSELESECRIQNQRTMELEAQLEDLRESTAGSAPSEEVADLRRNLATMTTKNSTLESENRRRKAQEEELESRIVSQAQQVTAFQDTLNRKDEEMRAMEDRYKRYLEKCKSVSTQTPSTWNVAAQTLIKPPLGEVREEPPIEKVRQVMSSSPMVISTARVYKERLVLIPNGDIEQSTPVRQAESAPEKKTPNELPLLDIKAHKEKVRERTISENTPVVSQEKLIAQHQISPYKVENLPVHPKLDSNLAERGRLSGRISPELGCLQCCVEPNRVSDISKEQDRRARSLPPRVLPPVDRSPVRPLPKASTLPVGATPPVRDRVANDKEPLRDVYIFRKQDQRMTLLPHLLNMYFSAR